ncbi:Eukaryotic elongation factor-2 kinase [Puccinia graminis f. sp. tritici]|uniref:Eukaryotic elongation factor-2 kinase n=1 Tax=Puccinia graminis f. sp. tritici TaxID=56615 RepID=A0A5B0SES3_PUCGR|nr:Eukaryotic elongation factor-2 kinase [Puccinia graminis f. sp. tritici]
MFECGISFFQDKKLKKTGIMSYMQQIDTSIPQLYKTLQHQLWKLFSPKLLCKELVELLPSTPIGYTSLSRNKSFLNPKTLLLLVGQSTLKKPVQIDLIYEDNGEDTNTILATKNPAATKRSLRIGLNVATSRRPSSLLGNHPYTQTAITACQTENAWALGGIAGTVPARGGASLSTHLNNLGRPLSNSLNINPEGWAIAHRLIFNNVNVNPSRILTLLQRHHSLKATIAPLTVKVDHNILVGQGSMRKAFLAQVKNVRMYEASGHLLQAYQSVIKRCPSKLLSVTLRENAKAFKGVGSTITDPQIIDCDDACWADGNNASKGINHFLENHVCNDVCRALKLGSPTDITPEVTEPDRSVQSQVARATIQAAQSLTGPHAMTDLRTFPGLPANPAQSRAAIGNLLRTEVHGETYPNMYFFASELNHHTSERGPVNTSGR